MRPVLAPWRALVPLAAVLVTAVLLAPAGSAYPERRTHDREFPVPGVGDFVVADLTGDDWPDLAAADDLGGYVWIFEGGPAGLPPSPTEGVIAPGIRDLAVGDLEGDGRPELFAVDGARAFWFDPASWTPALGVPAVGGRNIASGDFDGNGLADLAILGSEGADIWFQRSAGVFDGNATLSLSEGVAFHDLAAGDVNGDGRDDLVIARPYEVRAYLQGALGLDPKALQVGTRGTSGEASLGIIGGAGGIPYLVAANAADGWGDAHVGLWRWSDGDFHLETSFVGPYSSRLAVGDVNDDGLPDLVVAAHDGTVPVFLQRSAAFGTGTPDFLLEAASQTDARVAVGDANGDGFEDVLVRASGKALVFLQEDAMPRFIRAIPSTYVVNRGAVAPELIDLRQFFTDDHNGLTFSVAYASDPEHLAAMVEGTALSFEAADWYGTAQFRASAWDGNPSHPPVQSNLFTVLVNDVPVITSVPVLRATAGRPYAYVVTAADAYPANEAHAFALLEGPAGMAVDAATGLVTWTPTDAQAGSRPVALQVTDGNGGAGIQRFVVVVAPAAGGSPVPLMVLGVALSSAALLAAAAVLNENAKYAFLLFFLPLYSKIKRERVLDHFVRGQIFGYITANPGEHYNAIKDALGLTNGSLAHHLRTLEREQFIKSKRYGLYRRFYPMSFRMPAEDAYQPNEIQVTILQAIRERPGITQKEIAERLGLSPPTVNYHVSALSDRNLIRVDRRGRSTHCVVVEGSSP